MMFYRVVCARMNQFVPYKQLAKTLSSLGFGDYYEDAKTGYFELTNDNGDVILSVLKA
jgi:hypothetical protein